MRRKLNELSTGSTSIGIRLERLADKGELKTTIRQFHFFSIASNSAEMKLKHNWRVRVEDNENAIIFVLYTSTSMKMWLKVA